MAGYHHLAVDAKSQFGSCTCVEIACNASCRIISIDGQERQIQVKWSQQSHHIHKIKGIAAMVDFPFPEFKYISHVFWVSIFIPVNFVVCRGNSVNGKRAYDDWFFVVQTNQGF